MTIVHVDDGREQLEDRQSRCCRRIAVAAAVAAAVVVVVVVSVVGGKLKTTCSVLLSLLFLFSLTPISLFTVSFPLYLFG